MQDATTINELSIPVQKKLGYPFVLVLIYLGFEYIRPQSLIPAIGYLRIPMLVSIILAIAWFKFKPKVLKNKQIILFFILLFFYAISVPFAYNNYWAYKVTEEFFILLVGFLLPLVTFANSFHKVNLLFISWIYIHFFLAVMGIRNKGVGIGGFLQDENDFALAINMVLPYAYFLALQSETKRKKIILIAITIVYLITIVYTFSRGGFVGLLAVAFYLWLRSSKKILGVIVAIMAVVLFFVLAPPDYLNEVSTITDTKENTAQSRLYFWEIATNMFLDHPILGVGPQSFPFVITNYDYKARERERSSGGMVAHSMIFQVLSEMGIIGLLIFSLLIYYNLRDAQFIRKVYRKRYELAAHLIGDNPEHITEFEQKITYMFYLSLALVGSLIAYISSGMFISVFYYPHFWILTAFFILSKNYVTNYLQELENLKGITQLV